VSAVAPAFCSKTKAVPSPTEQTLVANLGLCAFPLLLLSPKAEASRRQIRLPEVILQTLSSRPDFEELR
jgi:hypothetical protein